MPEISFLTNHAKTLLVITHDLRIRTPDIARLLDLTERRTRRIVADRARTGCSERVGRDADPNAAVMDAQSVKTVEASADSSGYDGHKCLKGWKRHLLVDTLGLLIAVYFTPADRLDPAARASSWQSWQSWQAWRSACHDSGRSGRMRPTAARTWPTGASSRVAGSSRTSSASQAPDRRARSAVRAQRA
jgi:hypothetical protein